VKYGGTSGRILIGERLAANVVRFDLNAGIDPWTAKIDGIWSVRPEFRSAVRIELSTESGATFSGDAIVTSVPWSAKPGPTPVAVDLTGVGPLRTSD
jgi:hypothetical protein